MSDVANELKPGTVHRSDLFKVVNTVADRYTSGKHSALLHSSRARLNYDTGKLYLPPLPGTPVLAFTDLASAYAFADKFQHRRVHRLDAYGEIVPVDRVLKIKHRGWDRNLESFWKAVREGSDLDPFDTMPAAPNSVAVWGVVCLLEFVPRPPTLAASAPAGVVTGVGNR